MIIEGNGTELVRSPGYTKFSHNGLYPLLHEGVPASLLRIDQAVILTESIECIERGKVNINGYCRLGLRLTLLSLALLPINFVFETGCFVYYSICYRRNLSNCKHCSEHKLGAVNLQHACHSHKNVILNEQIKPRSWHPHFNVYNLNADKTWAP